MAKPAATYVIDTGNSLATSLVFACLLNEGSGTPTDLVTLATSAALGGAAWTTMTNGDPGRIYAAEGDGDYFAGLNGTGVGTALSLVAITDGSASGIQSGGTLFSKADGNAGAYDFMLRRSGGTDNAQLFYGAGLSQDSGVSATNKTFIGLAADATSVFWNVDGSTATGAGITLVDNLKRLVIGGRYLHSAGDNYDLSAGQNNPGLGKISAVFWWSRKLSAAELVTLQGDPWAFLIPGGTFDFTFINPWMISA